MMRDDAARRQLSAPRVANRERPVDDVAMRCTPTLLFVVAGLGLLAACDEPREMVLLADFDVAHAHDDSLYGPGWIRPRGLHQFDGGWRQPELNGIWTTGTSARVHFECTGTRAELTLRLATHPILAERRQELTLFWNETELSRHELRAQWQPDTLRITIPKRLFRSGTGTLRLDASEHLGPADGFAEARGVFVQSMQLSAQLTESEREAWHELVTPLPAAAESIEFRSKASERATKDLPDLLMILIDTARADHFSSYGYARETTPHIDALAARGVRFDRVFAEAPYTRNSVATLFTGSSWRDHRVLGAQDALSEDHFTMAEALRAAGYQTLAISDNANVGQNAGSTQGFEEFVEAWKELGDERRGRSERWWPEAPLRLFEERLAKGFDPARPVFFYLHLLPPHEPYYPGEGNDIFGPSDYTGPITGTSADIVAFDQGERVAAGEDHERLVSLYDGSLRRADALVQRALDAWKTRAPRPTLTILLSDHGEAFGEHGRFGHNSTPFDEMLHVPFVMSPRELVPAEVRAGRTAFRSLGDVYPLLLRTLGLGLPAGTRVSPTFIEAYEQPNEDRREIFVRCGVPRYARRTPTTLMVFRDWQEQAYFDLSADPQAKSNLRWKQNTAWRTERKRMRDFLAEGADSPEADAAQLSPEDIERLKALGYM
jgi:arylsulfatase A-like enzyme